MSWRDSISRPSGPASLGDLNAYVVGDAGPTRSPIDYFHEKLQEILAVATPKFLEDNPGMGPLFVGGLVPTTEEFLRSLFGHLLELCPEARAQAAEKVIHLGSAVWHGQGVVSRGAFEGMSLAGKANIKRTIKDFLGYDLSGRDRVWGALDEYDKVCELRHGIVHSGVTMPGKNAVKLSLSPVQGTPRLRIGFDEVQECAAVCTALAVSLNLDLFAVMTKRWATTWRKQPAWGSRTEHEHFKKIWSIFYSDYDSSRGLIANPSTVIRCRNAAGREFV